MKQGDVHAVVATHALAVKARDTPGAGKESLQRVPAEQQDDVRLQQRDLLIEVVAAGLDLERFGIAIAGRTALDDVGDVDVAPIQPG